ncbi:hypothetical protein BT63DRAFT_425639 [Microthyrium microscopicum]|uniref:Peroxisome membrane anchor protein Pex14p N-terminal domain-containing protein n=1 Tax=Microthyrium microscopicum TaxID=703497 RepID=A0A6A6U9N4_9PEZI|nr:hypothetical protein BT63DRAFT_425639 [Microthyrium microscopicum]
MAKDDASIPAWQRASASPSQAAPEDGKGQTLKEAEESDMPEFDFKDSDGMSVPPTREEAAKFLQHPGTEKAGAEEKIRFLEVKGVKQDDIEALIPEAQEYFQAEQQREAAELARESEPQSRPQSIPEARRDVPPLVTYPEFLVQRQKPAPLITTNFLLNTMYGTVGAIAGMYGLSKYYLQPMHQELSEARHEFFGHASSKLDDLTEKLSKVTTLPPKNKPHDDKDANGSDNESDGSDGDPTELFHRDIGVQTSPSLSRPQSSWSIADSQEGTAPDPLSLQTSRIASLASQIRNLEQSRTASGGKEKDISDQLGTFSTYLNELMYSSPYYSYKNTVPTWNNTSSTPSDEFDRLRQEIRSMKGVMLSARNFPRRGT